MKRILTLKAWQVFVLFFAVIYIPGIIIARVFGANSINPEKFYVLFLILLWCICTYTIAKNLYLKLPENNDLRFRHFQFFFFCFIVLAVIYITTYYLVEKFPIKEGLFSIIHEMLVLFVMFSVWYCIYFIAKAIATIENHRMFGHVRAPLSDYFGYMILIWFFPIGIWWIQPKIKRIFSEPVPQQQQ